MTTEEKKTIEEQQLELRARAARGPGSCADSGEKWGPSDEDDPQEWWPAAWYEMTEKGQAALAAKKAEGPEWWWPPEAKARLKAERAAEAAVREVEERAAASNWGQFKLWAAAFVEMVLSTMLALIILAAVVGLLVLAFSTAPWWAVVIILLLLAILIFR